MSKFEVSLKLFFNQKSPSDIIEECEEVSLDEIEQSFKDTKEFIMEDHLKNVDLYEFVSYLCSLGVVEEETVKLLPDNTVSFIYETDDEDVSEKELFDNFLFSSLEDSEYEGESGWVIMTKDDKYEYGLIDYRKPENIIVKKL
jgi:hypothetical protein